MPMPRVLHINLFWAVFNLVPVQPLDGVIAWGIFPLLKEEWQSRSRAKKAAADLLRRLK